MMQRFFNYTSIVFLFVIILASCKSQKQLTQSTKTPVDSLAIQPTDSSLIAEQLIPEDTIISEPDSVVISFSTPLPIKKDTIIISAVGDVMLGTNFPESYYLPPNEGKDMLSGVSSAFTNSDIVFGNLEGVILNSGGTQKECRNPKACYLFRSPEYMALSLHEAGFNLFSVANNHAGDFGPEGRANTARLLDSLEIKFAGNFDHPFTMFEKDGILYGFAAFAPNKGTPNINDLKSAAATITHLDSLVDIVVVSFHGGAEGSQYTSIPKEHEYFYGEDRGNVYQFAHTMIDNGADIIIGHGPHVPRAVEVYKKRFITYSLGNFATYARFNLRGSNGLAPIVKISMTNEGEFLSGQIISAKQVGWGVPEIDYENLAAKLIRELSKKDISELSISIDESGFISYLHL
jgi:poly-gamma-glutamate capsule biosynthesis protein CapA/YwtB (metallophosphatase superfamily)